MNVVPRVKSRRCLGIVQAAIDQCEGYFRQRDPRGFDAHCQVAETIDDPTGWTSSIGSNCFVDLIDIGRMPCHQEQPLNAPRVSQLGRSPVTDQTLLMVDVGGGVWLYRDESSPDFKGIATIFELHYATSVQDVDRFTVVASAMEYKFNGPDNRIDILNLTFGLHAVIGRTKFRVAGVFPVRDGNDAPYDAEVNFSANRNF